MRPKTLEIEGLQSFRDKQVIDFDALGETGLFGIFGPTGSGKSTVLDAITFALYGRVKRAERGTQGIINTNMDTARVTFSFELQKDGRRRTYRVERTYQRKKGSENSSEPKVARLIEVTDAGEIPVCDKASEIGSSIEELIGLNHDDFTRAVVLPQNSFQEFLLLDNSKKRDMLERIFYLEEYGKQLWDKLSRKMAALKSRIDVLSGELTGYSDATDEALKEAEKTLGIAHQERLRVEKELKKLETMYNEAREVWQLTGELSLVENREIEHIAGKTGMDEKRGLLDRAIKAEGLQESANSIKNLTGMLRDTEKELKVLLGVIPDAHMNLESSRSRYEQIRAEAAVKQPEMLERRARLTDALNVKAEITGMMRVTSELEENHCKLKNDITKKNGIVGKAASELGILEKQILDMNNEIDSLKISSEYRRKMQEGFVLEKDVSSAAEKIREMENKHGELCTLVDGLEKKLSAVKPNIMSLFKKHDEYSNEISRLEISTTDDRSILLKKKDEINSWKSVYGALILRKNDADSLKSKISVKQANLKEMIDKAECLRKIEAEAKSKLEESRLYIEEKTREMDRNIAYRLSKKLIDGEPCPVCGSEHHPGSIVHSEDIDLPELEKELENLKLGHTSLEEAFKKAEKSALVAVEQVNALKTQISQELQELDTKNEEYEFEKTRLPEGLSLLEVEHISLELARMEGDNDERLTMLDKRDRSLESCKLNLQKVNDELSNEKKLEYGLITELKVTRENMEQAGKTLDDTKNSLEGRRKLYVDFLQMYGVASASGENSRIADNDRKIEALQNKSAQSSERLAKDRSVLEKLKEELQGLNNDHIKMETELFNQKRQMEEKENRLRELSGELDISGEIAKINKKLEEYASSEGKLQENIKELEKRYNELISRKTALEKQQEIFTNSFQSENTRLETMMKEKGFSDVEEIAGSLMPTEQQKALREQINEYDQIGTNIQAQKGILLKKLNSRRITEEEWSGIDNKYKYMCSYKEECVSKSEVAKSSYNSLKTKHDKWVELDGRHRELTNKSGLYSNIQKLLKAEHGKDNSFIDYIAEERLRYVAAKASETLGFMTKYKYALELDTNAGFIICDNSNGGVHRMITSLSGGETFLTSLSLALALSEQIQLKGQSPLEFFFLDEGFGTLDNDLLETVIDSLERLSSRERVIGLISHVPELRNRIARRLVVEPPSMKGDGSKVTVEKA